MSFGAPSYEAPAIGSDERSIVDGSKGEPARFDPLADLVVRRWFDAFRYRQSETIGPCSIEATLQQCYYQRRGIYLPEEQQMLDGIDVYVPLTEMKAMAAEAWLRDMLAGVLDMPFTIEPTPIPELPERLRQKVLRDLKLVIADAASGGNPLMAAQMLSEMPPQMADIAFGAMIAEFPDDLEKVAAGLKEGARALAFAEAKQATTSMGLLIKDQLVEMNFARVMHEMFYDLVTFPFAVIKGPVIVEKPRIRWRGNLRVVEKTARPECYRVSPFDFLPSPDSPDTQRGTYVIEKMRMTRRTLAWARNQKYWIPEQVDRVLTEYATWQRNWLLWDSSSRNLEQPQPSSVAWGDDETIDVLEHHGILSGRELRQYGFSAGDGEFYEARVTVCGGRTLAVRVCGEPHVAQRPYLATSYQKMGEQFYGTCPVMKLRDVQRTVNATCRAQIRNMSFSSGPLAEIDVSRVQRFVTDIAQLLRVEPYSALFTDPDMMNGGRPARQFHNVPQILVPLQNTIAFYMRMADDVSNIPAYAQGEAAAGGIARTFRGFSAHFAQALKVFKVPVQNMDHDIFQPLAVALYNYNMTTSNDQSIKGDALVRARGSQGLVDLEQQQQKALEALQVVMQMSPAAAEVAPEEARQVLRFTWAKAMEALGIPMKAFGVNPDVEAALAAGDPASDLSAGPATPIPAVSADQPPPG